MLHLLAMRLQLVPYDAEYLQRSWKWLQDEEIKRLTMTPDFTREDQRRFFEALPHRTDYRIWGVAWDGAGPIGAAGLKNMRDGAAEYWGYIGERACWGRGLGREMLAAVERQAVALRIRTLTLNVGAENRRAVRLYEAAGFWAPNPAADILLMTKDLG